MYNISNKIFKTMSKNATTIGCLCEPHGDWPPSPIITSASTVTIEGKLAARVGDTLAPHVNGKGVVHSPSISAGSSTVFIEGKAAARIGDNVSCGSKIMNGSSTVIIG